MAFMNEKRFEHNCHNGTEFIATRCDFQGGVRVVVPKGLSEERLMCDVAEMIGYHATNIHPDLNGFSGYGNVAFNIQRS